MWCYKLLYLILAHNSASKTRCFWWERNWWLIGGLNPGLLAHFQAVYQLSCKANQSPPAPPAPLLFMKGKGFHISQRSLQEYVKDVSINTSETVQRNAALRQEDTSFPEKGFAEEFLSSLRVSPHWGLVTTACRSSRIDARFKSELLQHPHALLRLLMRHPLCSCLQDSSVAQTM